MSVIQRNTTSLREGVNVWSLEKRLRPNSESIMMLKDHTMKSTLMDLRLTRGLGQQQSTTAISRMVRRPAASCPKIIFAAEATAISLALNYYQHMGPVQHDVVVYSDSMSCFQAIDGEDTKNPFICHIMNLLWSLSDKGTHVRFCWVPSHCGIDGNERVDQLAKETIDQDIDPMASIHYTDMKPLVNSYIQKLVQTKWDIAVYGRDLCLVKPTLGPPKKFQHLTRAEEVVITRLRFGHTKATKSHILSRGPPTGCHHWSNTDHWPYAAGVCTVTGMSWWILHSGLVECSLWDNSWDLHSRIPARSGILLSDMM